MTETETPRAKPGTFCPLWRKDVSKVCHTCAWWHPLTVENPQKQVFVQWQCAIVHQMTISRDIGLGMLGVQQATESHRNEHIRRMDEQRNATLVMIRSPSDPAQLAIESQQ